MMSEKWLWNWPLDDIIDGLVQDCGISSAEALEIPQSCTTPSLCCIGISIDGKLGLHWSV